jgi:hypothetical protein
VALYIHSPRRLHGPVLNQLSTGTTLPWHVLPVGSGQILLLSALSSGRLETALAESDVGAVYMVTCWSSGTSVVYSGCSGLKSQSETGYSL